MDKLVVKGGGRLRGELERRARAGADDDALGQPAKMTLYLDGRELPEVNDRPINLAPEKVYDSPYLTSAHGSGVVTIQKSPRRMKLDFTRTKIIEERF